MKAPARTLLAALPLLLLVPPLRHAVEASMSLHMLLQLPLLFAAGWGASAWLPRRLAAAWARLDALGLSSATLASVVAAFWMIPAALDLAVLGPPFSPMALAKYLSCWLAGLLLAQGWPRLRGPVAAFFLGNASWMLLTAGLLYGEAESRLCVSYRFDEQALSGAGLLAAGLLLGALALLRLRRPSLP